MSCFRSTLLIALYISISDPVGVLNGKAIGQMVKVLKAILSSV